MDELLHSRTRINLMAPAVWHEVAVWIGIGLLPGPEPTDIAKNLSSELHREDTAKIAHNFDSPEVREALILSLDDESLQVKLNAVKSLVHLEEAGAVPKLISMLEQAPKEPQSEMEAKLYREVIDALGQLKQPEAVPALIAHIRANQEPKPPLNAVWALGFLEDNASLELLTELVEHRSLRGMECA